MTFELLERDWLSLRYWLLRCVLPTSSILVLVLLIMRWISTSAKELNHSALIVGFFALYFVVVRAGHLIMIRSLHFELKRKHEQAYREKLAYVSTENMKRHNIGFTLARIKRELITSAKDKNRSPR